MKKGGFQSDKSIKLGQTLSWGRCCMYGSTSVMLSMASRSASQVFMTVSAVAKRADMPPKMNASHMQRTMSQQGSDEKRHMNQGVAYMRGWMWSDSKCSTSDGVIFTIRPLITEMLCWGRDRVSE